MNHKKQATPIWPFMIALVFLFAMSITSPRGWEEFAQRSELTKPTGTAQGPKPAGVPFAIRPLFVASDAAISAPLPAPGLRAETRPRITSEFTTREPVAKPSFNLNGAATNNTVAAAPAVQAPTFAPTTPFRLNGSPRVQAIETSSPKQTVVDLTSSFDSPKPAETAKPVAAAVVPKSNDGPRLNNGPRLNAAPAQPVVAALPNLPAQPNLVARPSIAVQPMTSQPTLAPQLTVAPLPTVGPAPKIAAPTLAPPQTAPTVAVAQPNISIPKIQTSAPATPSIAAPAQVAPVVTKVAPVMETAKITAPKVEAPKHEPAPAGFSLNGTHRTTIAAPTPAPIQSATATPTFVAARPEAGSPKNPLQSEASTNKPSVAPVDPRYAPLPKPRETAVVEPTAPAEKSWWPKPSDLFVRLDRLQQRRETKPWAERTAKLLDRLSQLNDTSPARIQETVAMLRAAVADTHLVDEQGLDPNTAVEVRLTRHALLRRLDVWESLGNLLHKGAAPSALAGAGESKQLELCLVELDRHVSAAGETGAQWRNYLMLDSLGDVAEGKVLDRDQRRTLAQTVLARIQKAGAHSEENKFLYEGPFAQLNAQLRGLAAEEVDGRVLLESIEKFEAGGLPADAHALAEQCRLLDVSADEERRQLAVWLTSHYRNANIRVTLSADLLNRMMPAELTKSAPVNEYVLGLPTQGWSTTRTGVGIRFLPSQDRLAMRMEAEGAVQAQTRTDSGPVRVFNQSDSNFIAHKDLALTPEGVIVYRAVASTHSRNRLRGIKTDFDHVPILGSIVESIALDQHAEKKPLAQAESQARVSRGVERGLDVEIDKHLKTADAALKERIIAPLANLQLEPEVIEMQSNESRAIMRVRIAGEDQLASHTPRPRAYSDNVGSVQVHQSAVNNILEKSNLAGRRFTLPELYRFVVEKYYLPDNADVSELPTDIELTFAKVDPITVRCEAGRIELRLAVEELSRGDKSWRDFVVKAAFKTDVVQGRTCFVRDGIVKLSGPKLSMTSQIPLRTVFAKVFPDDMCVVLWPDKFSNDPRFADLDIEQVDIRDGWIGMAIGPRRLQASALLSPKR
jgi:hypothetical protein